MKLGIDGRELQTGARTGIGRYLREVLLALDRKKWDCVVYGDRSTALPEDLAHLPVKRLATPWTSWWDQITLPASLRRDEVTVFFSPYYKCPLRTPCPTVITIHDLLFIGYPGTHRPIYDRAMTGLATLYSRRAASIIADSHYSKHRIVTRLRVNPGKVHVIPVTLGSEFRPTAPDDTTLRRYGIDAPYLLCVGNFKPHKNLPRLLQAYAALPPALRGRYRLVLAGGDAAHRPELDRLVLSLGIASHVRFPGLIDDRDLPMLYSACSLFVLPSLEEGFGLPALEAMACGTAVVASNRASLPEVVGAAAVLCDPTDKESMTSAIRRVLEDPSLQDHLGSKGLERARHFTPDHAAERVIQVIEQAASFEHRRKAS